MRTLIFLLSISSFLSACSFFGIQDEEGPEYVTIKKSKKFEIREYQPYIVAKVTVKGNYDESSGEAFKILAGYIFGDNSIEKEISMTSPVKVKEKSQKIDMTSPVKIKEDDQNLSMAFFMPSKYDIKDLPRPRDNRIRFEKIEQQKVAVLKYSWFSSSQKNKKKAKRLRNWINNKTKYQPLPGYSFAGYNPPWTLPPFKRNEVHIELK